MIGIRMIKAKLLITFIIVLLLDYSKSIDVEDLTWPITYSYYVDESSTDTSGESVGYHQKLFHMFRFSNCINSSLISSIFNNYCINAEMYYFSRLTISETYDKFFKNRDLISTDFRLGIPSDKNKKYTYRGADVTEDLFYYYSNWIYQCFAHYLSQSDSVKFELDKIYRSRDDPSFLRIKTPKHYSLVLSMTQPLFWLLYIDHNADTSTPVPRNEFTVTNKFLFSAEIAYGLIHKSLYNSSLRNEFIEKMDTIESKPRTEGYLYTNYSFKFDLRDEYSEIRPFPGKSINNYELIEDVVYSNSAARCHNARLLSFSYQLRCFYLNITYFGEYPVPSYFPRTDRKNPGYPILDIVSTIKPKLEDLKMCDDISDYYHTVSILSILYEVSRSQAYGFYDGIVLSTIAETRRYVKNAARSLTPEVRFLLFGKLNPRYLELKKYIIDTINTEIDITGESYSEIFRLYSELDKGDYSSFERMMFELQGVYGHNHYHIKYEQIKKGIYKLGRCN